MTQHMTFSEIGDLIKDEIAKSVFRDQIEFVSIRPWPFDDGSDTLVVQLQVPKNFDNKQDLAPLIDFMRGVEGRVQDEDGRFPTISFAKAA